MIHSYPWYISDWRDSETRHTMTTEERGLYRELLDFCYRDGSLPTDPTALRRISDSTDEEFHRAWPRVSLEFEQRDGRLVHPKVTHVLEKLDGYRDQRAAAGRKSGEARRRPKNEHAFNERSRFVQRESTSLVEPSSTPASTTSPASLARSLREEIAKMQNAYPGSRFAQATPADAILSKIASAGGIEDESDVYAFAEFVAARFTGRDGGPARQPGYTGGPNSPALLVKWAEDWRRKQPSRETRTA